MKDNILRWNQQFEKSIERSLGFNTGLPWRGKLKPLQNIRRKLTSAQEPFTVSFTHQKHNRPTTDTVRARVNPCDDGERITTEMFVRISSAGELK